MEKVSRKQRLGWGSVLLWVGATLLTWAVWWAPWASNDMLFNIAVSTGEDPGAPFLWVLSGILSGVVTGGILGLIQWFILRKHISRSGSWFIATFVGMALGLCIGVLLGRIWINEFRFARHWQWGQQFAYPDLMLMAIQSAFLEYLPVGLALGFAQWMVLRTIVRGSWWWLPVSLVVWPAAAVVYWLGYGVLGGPFCQSWTCMFDPPGPGYYPASTVGWLMGGLTVGTATGVVLKSLLRTSTMPEH